MNFLRPVAGTTLAALVLGGACKRAKGEKPSTGPWAAGGSSSAASPPATVPAAVTTPIIEDAAGHASP
jgi:hypothetical protein